MPSSPSSFLRDHAEHEIPWVRPSELSHLPALKRPLAIVNGAFDLLHTSHLRLIHSAAARSSSLICLLDTDEKIASEKGAARPILTFPERASALNYTPISLIVPISSSAELAQSLALLKPDFHVLGEEYRGKKLVGSAHRCFSRMSTLHTSSIIERILARYVKP